MEPNIEINYDAIAVLRTRQVGPTLPAQAWPTQALQPVTEEVRVLAESTLTMLRGNPGFVVLQFDAPELDDHELTEAAWNLFTLLGKPIPQYWTGELVYPVEVTESASGTRRYTNNSRSGGFHTDGTLLPQPPDFAALLGLSVANVGGETVLMDGVELCRRLDEADPIHVQELARPHHFDAQCQISGMLKKIQPIVSCGVDGFEMRYLREGIEEGYAAADEQLPDLLVAAMDLLDEASSDEAVQNPILLRRGMMLLWNNRRFLHGRRPFEERGSRRRLRRMFGKLVANHP